MYKFVVVIEYFLINHGTSYNSAINIIYTVPGFRYKLNHCIIRGRIYTDRFDA